MVVKDTHERFIKRIKDILVLTKPKIAADFIVYNENEIQHLEETNNNFYRHEIIEKGKVIYDEGI